MKFQQNNLVIHIVTTQDQNQQDRKNYPHVKCQVSDFMKISMFTLHVLSIL